MDFPISKFLATLMLWLITVIGYLCAGLALILPIAWVGSERVRAKLSRDDMVRFAMSAAAVAALGFVFFVLVVDIRVGALQETRDVFDEYRHVRSFDRQWVALAREKAAHLSGDTSNPPSPPILHLKGKLVVVGDEDDRVLWFRELYQKGMLAATPSEASNVLYVRGAEKGLEAFVLDREFTHVSAYRLLDVPERSVRVFRRGTARFRWRDTRAAHKTLVDWITADPAYLAATARGYFYQRRYEEAAQLFQEAFGKGFDAYWARMAYEECLVYLRQKQEMLRKGARKPRQGEPSLRP